MKLSKETALYEKDAIKNGINNAAGTATKYVTLIDDDTGIFVSPEGEGPKDKPNTKTGWSISDAIELFKNGVSYIKAWLNNDNKPEVRIGATTSYRLVLSDNGIEFIDDNGEKLGSIKADTGSFSLANGFRLKLNENAWEITRGFISFQYNQVDEAFNASNVISGFDGFRYRRHERIGTVKTATKSAKISTTGISNYTQGPKVSLPPGTWMVVGNWNFTSLGDRTTRQTSVRLNNDSTDETYNTVTVCNGASWGTRLEVTSIITIPEGSDSYDIYLEASSTRTTDAATQSIKAVCII